MTAPKDQEQRVDATSSDATCAASAGQLFVHRLDDDGVLTVAGEIDEAVVGILQRALAQPTVAAIDMSHITFINSSGLRMLLEAQRRLGEIGRRLEIRNPSRAVRRVLELTGLTALFQPDSDE